MAPLDELKRLEAQISSAASLDALKPIYARLDDIAQTNSGDFEVQLVVADLREHLVHKGVNLRRSQQVLAGAPAGSWWLRDDGKLDIKRALMIGAGLGVVGWLVLFITLVQIARYRNIPQPQTISVAAASPAAAGTVPVDIVTTPPGATIQINNDTKCTSNCRVNLAPGNYQVTAMLDGFDPAATGVTVVPGSPINVSLALLNQTQTVRVYTDLPSGKVYLDGKPAPDLQDGQLVLDRVKNGKHEIRVAGPAGQAKFAFELLAGKEPVITGPIVANNLISVVVSSLGSNAHVQSSSPAMKVSLNGQPQGETGPNGLDLKNVPPGDQQLAIGQGSEQHKMVVPFGPMPSLTAFLKSDINSGTLVVSTGEDDVSVFIDGKEYRHKTKRGQLRIPLLGVVKVRVGKQGFMPEAEQTADVKKGEEARLAFKLRPLPQVAALQVHGAVPGTQVLVDDRLVGRVGADGALSAANLTPGEHIVELRRDGYVSKRSPRTFRAGEALLLSGADTALASAAGTIHLVLSPPEATVSYRRAEETQMHPVNGNALKLDPGNYVFTAKAPNHLDRTERVPVVAGETRNVELALARDHAATAVKPLAAAGTLDWSGWSNEGGAHVRKGGNHVPVRSGPLNGTITFTAQLRKGGGLFRGGKLRWYLDDGGRISQFEIDKKHFYTKGLGDEGISERFVHDEVDEKRYTVQIDVSPDRIIQKLKVGDRWVVLGSAPGHAIANGKFGFVIPGGDEVAVSDFHYAQR
jgi:hypothetical protein